ncbi:MAG: hypothetical protein AAB545_02625 [Patescibacteria group bacterium]
MKSFFLRHSFALLLSLFVGAVSIAPSLLAPWSLGADYHGLPFLYQSDETVYLARIHEVLDGHRTITSPFFDGYKDTPSLQLPFGEYFYALPALLFGLFPVVLVSKFLFPALLFLLAYFFLLQMFGVEGGEKERLFFALSGATFAVLGYDFVDFRSLVSLLLRPEPFHLFLWTRLVNPITGGLILFSALLIFWELFRLPKRVYLLLGGMLLMLSSGYVFSFGVAFVVASMLLVVSLVLGRSRSAVFFMGSIFLGILPFLIQFLSLSLANVTSDPFSLTRNGLFFTHEPLPNKLLLVATILFASASFLARRNIFSSKEGRKSDWWWFSVSILTGLFIAFNEQVITGMTIWPGHFVQYSIPLIILVGFATLFHIVRPTFSFLARVVAGGALAVSIAFGVWSAHAFQPKMPAYRSFQYLAPFFSWVNKNTPKDCVILARENLSGYIPAFTHCNVYYSEYVYSGVPLLRAEHGFFALLRLKGISGSKIEEYFSIEKDQFINFIFSDWAEKYYDASDPWLASLRDDKAFEERIVRERARLSQEYREFLLRDFELELKRYKIDYMVLDTAIHETLPTDMKRFTEEVASPKGFRVFKII